MTTTNKFKSPVREDKHGIYIITNGERYRPGGIPGYDHAFDMCSAGLKPGDKVWARHMAQSPLARITTQTERTVIWACDYLHSKYRKIK